MNSLKNKNIIVTGASGGVGKKKLKNFMKMVLIFWQQEQELKN